MDELHQGMTPAEKLQRVRSLTLMADRLAMAGLRSRHPDEPEERLMMRLARIRPGADLFERAYPGSQRSDGG